jgi:hypothetical protein
VHDLETQNLGNRRHWLTTALLEAGWAPVTVFTLHVLASRVLFLYIAYPPTDIAMHLLGGIAIAYFLWRAGCIALHAGVIGTVNRTGLGVMVFGLTCAAAVVWECAEFLSDRYFGTKAQLGLADTLGDMVVGIVGGVVFLAGVRLRREVPLEANSSLQKDPRLRSTQDHMLGE